MDILESETHLRKEIEKCGVLFRSPRLARVAAVIGIVLTSAGALGTFVFPRSSLTQSWISVHPLIVLIRFPITFIGNYALAILIFDLVIIVVTLYCLLKERQIRIEPFHPDNAGGMGMIWSFVVNLGYGFAAIGVALSVTTVYFSVSLSDLSGMMPWVIAYVVVASIVFVLPLYSAHRAMKDSRDRLIRKISMEFDSTFAQLNALQWANADEIETYLRKTRQLVETRDLVTRFPVWPVKLDSLGKFLGLILVPLLPTVFSTIIGIFSE
jgi:hypothetical protein